MTQTEITEELEDGKLYLFQRNGIFQARIYIGNRKYVWKSLSTRDIKEARSKGLRLLHEIEYKQTEDLPIQQKTFNAVINEYVAYRQNDYERCLQKKVNSSVKPTTSIYRLRQIIRIARFWGEYCGTTTIDRIDNAKLIGYVEWRRNYYHNKIKEGITLPKNAKLNPQDRTIEYDVILAKSLIKYAHERGYRGKTQLPTWRYITKHDTVRPALTLSEYIVLLKGLVDYAKEEKNIERKYTRELMRDYVYILANSGIRVGEANNLKMEDVIKFTDEDGRKNYMLNVNGKTGKRAVIPKISTVKYIERVIARNRERIKEEQAGNYRKILRPNRKIQDRENWFFCMYDGNRIVSLIDQFQALLKKLKIDKNRYGETYSLYSLRHFYAVNMLSKTNITPFDIARNMGTRVEIIERYYGKQATAKALATKLGGRDISRKNRTEDGVVGIATRKDPWSKIDLDKSIKDSNTKLEVGKSGAIKIK